MIRLQPLKVLFFFILLSLSLLPTWADENLIIDDLESFLENYALEEELDSFFSLEEIVEESVNFFPSQEEIELLADYGRNMSLLRMNMSLLDINGILDFNQLNQILQRLFIANEEELAVAARAMVDPNRSEHSHKFMHRLALHIQQEWQFTVEEIDNKDEVAALWQMSGLDLLMMEYYPQTDLELTEALRQLSFWENFFRQEQSALHQLLESVVEEEWLEINAALIYYWLYDLEAEGWYFESRLEAIQLLYLFWSNFYPLLEQHFVLQWESMISEIQEDDSALELRVYLTKLAETLSSFLSIVYDTEDLVYWRNDRDKLLFANQKEAGSHAQLLQDFFTWFMQWSPEERDI